MEHISTTNVNDLLIVAFFRVSGNQVSFRIMPNAKNVDPFKVVEKTGKIIDTVSYA